VYALRDYNPDSLAVDDRDIDAIGYARKHINNLKDPSQYSPFE
jgi:hypothetical protein